MAEPTSTYEFVCNVETMKDLHEKLNACLGSSDSTEETLSGSVSNMINIMDNIILNNDNWHGSVKESFQSQWADVESDLEESVNVIRAFVNILEEEKENADSNLIKKLYNEVNDSIISQSYGTVGQSAATSYINEIRGEN